MVKVCAPLDPNMIADSDAAEMNRHATRTDSDGASDSEQGGSQGPNHFFPPPGGAPAVHYFLLDCIARPLAADGFDLSKSFSAS
jgi:hypothetical protein